MAAAPRRPLVRTLTLVAGLAIGIAILAAFILARQPPPKAPDEAQITAVRYIEARPLAARITARGFGTAQSARPWQAVANVSGRIVERHPTLRNGSFVETGTRLLTIDPSRYQLNLEQAMADLRGIQAERRELEQEKENTEALYRLESDRLALAEQELARAQSLADRNMLSANQLDTQKRATIQQRQATQTLRNQLSQIPVKLDKLKAREEQAEARRDLAREDLEDTRITAPFDLRIGAVEVETGQQVNRGQRLFRADGIRTTEIPLQIPFAHMRDLVGALGPDALTMGGVLPSTDALGAIEASVNPLTGTEATWPARIVRVAEGLDPATRTLQVVLAVDEPYRNASPPERPALVPGSFVEGVLSHTVHEPRLAIPTRAVHEGYVYLVDENDRLERRAVDTSRPQGSWVLVRSGLEPGDRVIIDDPIPAIDGMPLRPSHAPDEAEKLAADVTGSPS